MSPVDRDELKRLIKDAVREVLAEDSESLKDFFVEVLEDAALLRRIADGRKSEFVDREQVDKLLEP